MNMVGVNGAGQARSRASIDHDATESAHFGVTRLFDFTRGAGIYFGQHRQGAIDVIMATGCAL